MTLVMLRWQNNKQKLSFIGAGHEYILHYSMREKTVHAIKSEGVALKMVLNISKILKETPIDFQEGDVVLLYTDGITEAKTIMG
jgi:serine phosphatase RsbU (regulator of sigma subunit)